MALAWSREPSVRPSPQCPAWAKPHRQQHPMRRGGCWCRTGQCRECRHPEHHAAAHGPACVAPGAGRTGDARVRTCCRTSTRCSLGHHLQRLPRRQQLLRHQCGRGHLDQRLRAAGLRHIATRWCRAFWLRRSPCPGRRPHALGKRPAGLQHHGQPNGGACPGQRPQRAEHGCSRQPGRPGQHRIPGAPACLGPDRIARPRPIHDTAQADPYLVVPAGQQVDPTSGRAYNTPSTVFNRQSGQFVQQPAQGGGRQVPAAGTVEGGWKFRVVTRPTNGTGSGLRAGPCTVSRGHLRHTAPDTPSQLAPLPWCCVSPAFFAVLSGPDLNPSMPLPSPWGTA